MLEETKALCKLYSIKPARSKGQNFLINQAVYEDIIRIAQLDKDDVVLEVGPGLGFLTKMLAKEVKQVVAVELDDKLANSLKFRLSKEEIDNIQVVNNDVLDFPHIEGMPEGFFENDYKVVANLPYNITSVFLRKFLEAKNGPKTMTLLLQKEVAERIVAKPGKMSILAISVQFYSIPKVEAQVKSVDFWPAPKVDSAVIHLEINNQYVDKFKDEEEIKLFFRLVKFGFVAKRKMLKNNLSSGLNLEMEKVEEILEKNNLDLKIRAQNLSLEDWLKIFGSLSSFMV